MIKVPNYVLEILLFVVLLIGIAFLTNSLKQEGLEHKILQSPGIYTLAQDGDTYIIEFYHTIEEANNYGNLFEYLDMLPQDSKIVINDAGYGGDSNALFTIIGHLTRFRDNLTIRVIAPVYSANAMLSCAGSHLSMLDDTLLMFHGVQGLDPVHAHIINSTLLKDYMTDRCSNLLSQPEIDYISTTGGEVYLSKKLVFSRLKDPKGNWHQLSNEGIIQ